MSSEPDYDQKDEQAGKKPKSAVDLLMSDDYWRGDLDIPARGQLRHRPLPEF
jgi:hypothetical protein